MTKKVLIDCDVGVDDAFALVLAFLSPELDVKAVTGVNGNVPLAQVFENIQKVFSLIRPTPMPLIAKGADRPLKGHSVYSHSIHGRSGLGGAEIVRREGEKWWDLFPGSASELISKTARQYPDELTLVATGPLTNVALALQDDPKGMRKLKEVVIMGGAVRTKGNVTPHAEFNVYVDPLAAKKVFESGLPTTLVPLDVTHQVFLTPRMIEERLKPTNTIFSQFVIEAIGYDFEIHRFREREHVYLHDPLAVGAVINPDLVGKERLPITAETREGEEYGKILGNPGGPELDVCLQVHADRFLALFLSRLTQDFKLRISD